MIHTHAIPYIEQRVRELGATSVHWEPRWVTVHVDVDNYLGSHKIVRLAGNQRLYVPLNDDLIVNTYQNVEFGPDTEYWTIESSTAKMSMRANQSVMEYSGVEHTGNVRFQFRFEFDSPHYTASIHTLVATFQFDNEEEPCPPIKTC